MSSLDLRERISRVGLELGSDTQLMMYSIRSLSLLELKLTNETLMKVMLSKIPLPIRLAWELYVTSCSMPHLIGK